jgi:iron-sulfur cluster repair protein YtfE (RIC family)
MSPQSKSKSSKPKRESTFFDLLKEDHDKVKDMFEQIEEQEEADSKEELFATLHSELQEHMAMEEKFFYPLLEQDESAREKALEAYEEHDVAKTVAAAFKGLDVENERWDAKIKVLQEIVNHHLQEEEKIIFKMAKKMLKSEQIKQITDQMMQMKSQAEKKAA